MTTSLKKAPEVTLWGFQFVYRLDTISFLATAIIAYASCLFNIHFFIIFGTKNEFLNSTAQWGDGILSRTVDIYSFIQSCYGYDSF